MRSKHGYPGITPALRAKTFGMNAASVYGIAATEVKKYLASDPVARERAAYLEQPQPHFSTCGLKSRWEFLALRAIEQP